MLSGVGVGDSDSYALFIVSRILDTIKWYLEGVWISCHEGKKRVSSHLGDMGSLFSGHTPLEFTSSLCARMLDFVSLNSYRMGVLKKTSHFVSLSQSSIRISSNYMSQYADSSVGVSESTVPVRANRNRFHLLQRVMSEFRSILHSRSLEGNESEICRFFVVFILEEIVRGTLLYSCERSVSSVLDQVCNILLNSSALQNSLHDLRSSISAFFVDPTEKFAPFNERESFAPSFGSVSEIKRGDNVFTDFESPLLSDEEQTGFFFTDTSCFELESSAAPEHSMWSLVNSNESLEDPIFCHVLFDRSGFPRSSDVPVIGRTIFSHSFHPAPSSVEEGHENSMRQSTSHWLYGDTSSVDVEGTRRLRCFLARLFPTRNVMVQSLLYASCVFHCCRCGFPTYALLPEAVCHGSVLDSYDLSHQPSSCLQFEWIESCESSDVRPEDNISDSRYLCVSVPVRLFVFTGIHAMLDIPIRSDDSCHSEIAKVCSFEFL